MGVIAFLVALLFFGASTVCSIPFTVSSCDEFLAVDGRIATELLVTNDTISCDSYLRFVVRNETVLKSTASKVTFSNMAFKVYGSLKIEPDVVFTDVYVQYDLYIRYDELRNFLGQAGVLGCQIRCKDAVHRADESLSINFQTVEKNGGAIKVDLGGEVVFEGTAEFTDNVIGTTVEPYTTDGDQFVIPQRRKGAAIHNKGIITFHGDAVFIKNHSGNCEACNPGRGAAVSNHVKGVMYFMENLVMAENSLNDFYGGGEGGAFHNLGDVVVHGEANFTKNFGGRGGAIFQGEWGTFVFNGFASFVGNSNLEYFGGAICNFGGEFTFNNGSLFSKHFTIGRGGAIYNYNGGLITLLGPTTFHENEAECGGAIVNQETRYSFITGENETFEVPEITLPEDTAFLGNFAEVCNDTASQCETREATCGL